MKVDKGNLPTEIDSSVVLDFICDTLCLGHMTVEAEDQPCESCGEPRHGFDSVCLEDIEVQECNANRMKIRWREGDGLGGTQCEGSLMDYLAYALTAEVPSDCKPQAKKKAVKKKVAKKKVARRRKP